MMSDFRNRLTILLEAERDELYALPIFAEEERAVYFALEDDENQEMESLKSLDSRVHFILQLGYFKAKFIFFDCSFQNAKKMSLIFWINFFQDLRSLKKV